MTQVPDPTTGLDALIDRLIDAAPTPQPTGSAALPRLEALMAAAAAPDPGPQPGEQQALAAFRELVTEAAGTPSLAARRRRRQMTVVSLASTVVLLGSGVAAAATGSLPGAAQTTAKSMLGALGVHVPGPNAHAGTHPDQRGASAPPASGLPVGPLTPVGPDDQAEPTPPRPTHPATPAGLGTPPTPGNSAAARHHGNPTPHASGHPAPHHGQPSAPPTVAHHRSLPSTANPTPTSSLPRVMRGARPAISR